ncbi:RNA 3'-terminal phosphate cyclase [Litoribrevibacter euphylliae]|uniref:RNA 3'-terminal phosphate cyclase n=1 Tax=Litoribrevibacter euphylliae TaxID=1834034 RepID=A0ABV7HB54_9GAMM
MIEINGQLGEGGGQIFRTSLTLSMHLGKPVRIYNIRAGRSKPGLLRQHLTCLKAAQAICGAEVSGAELGSTDVTFKPGKIESGDYRFAIGSAGSTSLVFQTVFLPLCFSDGTSEITLEGGTHNGSAPSFDFIEQSFLPVINQLGYRAEVKLEQYGFYPAGGGAWRVRIQPTRVQPTNGLQPLEMMHRGEILERMAMATSSRIPRSVNERELTQVKKKCAWPDEALQQQMVSSQGPGNILSLRVKSQHLVEVIEVVGEKRVSAEKVAHQAIEELRDYLTTDVPVGKHLADQLLLPMVLGAGGQFTTLKPTQHLLTNIDVIESFTDINITLEQTDTNTWCVKVRK